MIWNMRFSEHIYNYTDINDRVHLTFKAETQTTYRSTTNSRCRYAAGVSYQEIQKMRKTQLSLCQGTRTQELLPFRQYVWQKPHYDLCLPHKQRHGQKSLGQLSKRPKTYGRSQQYQSRNALSKGNIVEEKLWHPRWIYPP